MTREELNLFLRILPSLVEHYKTVPNSLLAKKFGVFTVKMSGVNAVHLMLMENTMMFNCNGASSLKYIFDLKGSTVDRKVKGVTKTSTTLKDTNFLMAATKNKNLTKQAKRDSFILRKSLKQDV